MYLYDLIKYATKFRCSSGFGYFILITFTLAPVGKFTTEFLNDGLNAYQENYILLSHFAT